MIHTDPCAIQEEVKSLISLSPPPRFPLFLILQKQNKCKKGNHWGRQVATSCRSVEDACVVEPIGVVHCGSFVISKSDEQWQRKTFNIYSHRGAALLQKPILNSLYIYTFSPCFFPFFQRKKRSFFSETRLEKHVTRNMLPLFSSRLFF